MSEGAWVRGSGKVWNDEYQAWEDAWSGGYNPGTDEAALLNNLQYLHKETIGKIYYIQSYFNGSVTQNVPYRIIGINHEDATNTVDLMSMAHCTNLYWGNKGTWQTGKYTSSGLYSWLPNTCPTGYSSAIQAKMNYMTERWREATGNNTGTMQSRQTKCKLLNPWELSGTAIQATCSDFNLNYGEPYSDIFDNTVGADSNRIVYSDLIMSAASTYWTNSYYLHNGYYSRIFYVYITGNIDADGTDHAYAIHPVIRLSANPS